jgi:hypothetical protein
MILYTEAQLNKAYKKYNQVRIQAGMPMVTLEKYRPLFERNMEREWFE